MKIAMLARNANLYSHQRLKEAAEARGHTLDILNTTALHGAHRQPPPAGVLQRRAGATAMMR